MSIFFISCYFICLVCFICGFFGCFLVRYNILIFLIILELILLSIMILFICISYFLDDIVGFFFFFFLLSIAGAEASLGLAFFIQFYRLRGLLNLKYLNLLKG